MKRIIVSLDGTWQTKNQPNPTNVKLVHDCIADVDENGIKQVKKHFDGVATKGSKIRRTFNGMTGADIKERIKEAYKFIVENYEGGDEVVLQGFSRGAFTARTLNGMIYKSGILDPKKVEAKGETLDQAVEAAYKFYQNKEKPNNEKSKAFRANYALDTRPETVLACYDTVGSLGVPVQFRLLSKVFNNVHNFHDTRVNRNTKHAFHLAAIDEKRKNFPLTPMTCCENAYTNVEQVWCVGNHSSVGGGSDETSRKPISDIAGVKMIALLAERYGLGFNSEKVQELFQPDINAVPEDDFANKGFPWRLKWFKKCRDISAEEKLDDTVIERLLNNQKYRPSQLKVFANEQGGYDVCPLPK